MGATSLTYVRTVSCPMSWDEPLVPRGAMKNVVIPNASQIIDVRSMQSYKYYEHRLIPQLLCLPVAHCHSLPFHFSLRIFSQMEALPCSHFPQWHGFHNLRSLGFGASDNHSTY